MNKLAFLFAGVLMVTLSCKKETTAPPSIYGKWFFEKVNSKLYNNKGTLLDTTLQTVFTSDDFVEYYSDGTGYFSSKSKISLNPGLSLFTFTLKGTSLIQTGASQNSVLNETVTTLTVNNLSIHAVYFVSDPVNVEQTDEAVDDYTYHR